MLLVFKLTHYQIYVVVSPTIRDIPNWSLTRKETGLAAGQLFKVVREISNGKGQFASDCFGRRVCSAAHRDWAKYDENTTSDCPDRANCSKLEWGQVAIAGPTVN